MKETTKRVTNLSKRARRGLYSFSTLVMTYVLFMFNETFAYATASTNAITQPLTNLKTLMEAIVTAIGGILIVKSIMEIATAYQQQDSAGMASGVKQLVAGILMAMVSTVLMILGI